MIAERVALNQIVVGDCVDVMRGWQDNFVDTIITDPPYGIGFMGKAWDTFDPAFVEAKTKSYREGRGVDSDNGKKNRFASAAQKGGEYDRSVEANRKFQSWCCAWATEALRIAKPGAMMLVSGGTRTFHRMTAGLEDAGWQIRDCLMWLYGSGFPKSHNLHDRFEGWGTALKPAWEPIILAMKPCDGPFAENAERWGVSGLNIDGARIPTFAESFQDNRADKIQKNAYGKFGPIDFDGSRGRWPANLVLDEDSAAQLDGVSGASVSKETIVNNRGSIWGSENQQPWAAGHNDAGGASRFFYVAKSARAERNEGCEDLPDLLRGGLNATVHGDSRTGHVTISKNNHPTVKPLDLMKYLCQLTKTPTGGIVLDPFAGSGTTLWAAEYHNRPWLGIEKNPEYVKIAEARIARERSQLKMPL